MEVMTEGKVEGSAGRNQPNCRVEVAGGVASIGGRRIQLSKGVIALWHQDSSGTFHGFHDPERFKSRKEPAPITPEGVIQRSTSGGADVMAAVVKVPESGLLVVTSGYDGRRGWMFTRFNSLGEIVWKGSPSQWRELHAEVEEL
jgi:hypothetical protein